MITRLCLALALLAVSASHAAAWGFEAHKFIVDRAIELLPEPLRPFYRQHRVFLVEHSIDPDLWRAVGFEEEPPRHFVDLDAYGRFPFPDLPRDYSAAIEKFGPEMIEKNGVLPWRTAEFAGRLRRAFEQQASGDAPFALESVKIFSAVIGHYVGDGHVPFHAVLNYDGQLTRQHGIHSRFETELFQRYRSRLTIKPAPAGAIADTRAFMFDTLLASFQLAEPVLKADREAIGTKESYDDEYFDTFFVAVRPILERRLSESIAAVASVIAGAWEQAGKPGLPLQPPKVIQKVGPPERLETNAATETQRRGEFVATEPQRPRAFRSKIFEIPASAGLAASRS